MSDELKEDFINTLNEWTKEAKDGSLFDQVIKWIETHKEELHGNN